MKVIATVRYFQKNVRINQLKNNHKNFVHSKIMLRFGKTKVTKEDFHATKKPIKVWDVNVDNIVISQLVKTKTNYKYLIGYLDKAIRPLVLVMFKISGHVKAFKIKDENKDKNNKLMSFLQRMRSYQKNITLFGLRLTI